jgi:anti-sigma-K factor RskA
VTTPERDRLAELAGLHTMGALTAEERAELARAASSDEALRAEIASLERTAQALALAVPQVDPPAALRARVLSSVAGSSKPAPGHVVQMRPRTSALPAWLAAAAALVAAVGLGLWALQLRGALVEMSARVAAAESEVTEMRRVLGSEREQVRVLQAKADVLFAPDMVRVDLAGQKPAAPDAAARAFWSRRKGMTFSASALPPIPPSKVYQVWVIPATQVPISAGLLTPDTQGSALVHFATPADVPTPVALAVTLEPAGGVPQPTGDKVLVGSVGN